MDPVFPAPAILDSRIMQHPEKYEYLCPLPADARRQAAGYKGPL